MRHGLGVLALALALVACGGGDKSGVPRDISVSSSTAPAAPATTVAPSPPVTPAPGASRTCDQIVADGLQLASEHSNDVRGGAGADEALYRARAQILADEARSLGCPIPSAIEDLLR